MNAVRAPVLACLTLAAVFTPSGATAQRADGFALAMTGLELSLDLDYQEGTVTGWASYEIVNRSEVPVREVPFNLGRLMTVRAVSGTDGSPLAFTQDVTTFEDSRRRQVDHIEVTLDRPLAPGAAVTLKIHYGGFLVGYTETGSIYIKDRVDESFSILREDAFAWPILGTLNRSVNRVAPRPDFPFKARITVPEKFTVASGGRLVDRHTEGGRTTFTYESVAPVPFVNIPVAEYSILRREGLRVYYFPADSVGARRVLDSASRALDLLEQWFGPLGSAPELVVMEIPEVWGSQASLTGGIIQTADAFRQPERMFALYHELSHLWNPPDRDQPSARWNEGLASFLEDRMALTLDGWDGTEADIQRTAERVKGLAGAVPQVATVPFARYGEASLTDLSYRVGFLMFYSLHRILGDARFDAAIGRYYQDHWRDGGTFENLLDYLRKEAPVSLDTFFQDWVYTTKWYDELQAGKPLEEIGLPGS